jgi:hypothetical protein
MESNTMPGLKDIAPSFRTVPVKGVNVEVPGISAQGIAYLFYRFPVVRELIGGKDVQLKPEDLQALGPAAVAAIIATGCGDIADEEAEASAARLGAEDQLNLLEAVIGETMPSGPGPFVQRLTKMFGGLSAESMSIPAGISQSESND